MYETNTYAKITSYMEFFGIAQLLGQTQLMNLHQMGSLYYTKYPISSRELLMPIHWQRVTYIPKCDTDRTAFRISSILARHSLSVQYSKPHAGDSTLSSSIVLHAITRCENLHSRITNPPYTWNEEVTLTVMRAVAIKGCNNLKII